MTGCDRDKKEKMKMSFPTDRGFLPLFRAEMTDYLSARFYLREIPQLPCTLMMLLLQNKTQLHHLRISLFPQVVDICEVSEAK